METKQSGIRRGAARQLTGAFVAGMIGSGFATGQEVLQFFASYSLRGFFGMLVCLLIILLVGHGLLRAGQQQKQNSDFSCFLFFGKKPLGTVYLFLTPVFLFLILAVMIAGAGSTLQEYFGVNRYLGSAAIALLALLSYLLGFEKLMKTVSVLGSIVIVFLLLVGCVSIVRRLPDAAKAAAQIPVLSSLKPSRWWALSAVSYASMNFMVSAQYYAQLGVSAPTRREANVAAVLGSLALVLTIGITDAAILLSAQEAAQFDIPVLYLARQISPFAGFAFCIVLMLGIFSACATTMWTVCHQLARKEKRRGKWIAVLVAAGTYAVSFVPFSKLISVLYPLIGYLGIPFLVLVVAYEVKSVKKGRLPK